MNDTVDGCRVNGEIQLVLNTPLGGPSFYDERALRRAAVTCQVPMLTTLSAARAAEGGVSRLPRGRACDELVSHARSDPHALGRALGKRRPGGYRLPVRPQVRRRAGVRPTRKGPPRASVGAGARDHLQSVDHGQASRDLLGHTFSEEHVIVGVALADDHGAWREVAFGPVACQRRAPLVDLFLRYGARVRVVYVEAPAERLWRQNRARPDAVPEASIRGMMRGWEVPDLTEAHAVEWVTG